MYFLPNSYDLEGQMHIKPSLAPLLLTTTMIMEETGSCRRTINRLMKDKSLWARFWLLVQLLEKKGKRPDASLLKEWKKGLA